VGGRRLRVETHNEIGSASAFPNPTYRVEFPEGRDLLPAVTGYVT
jgi:hypothetical protein